LDDIEPRKDGRPVPPEPRDEEAKVALRVAARRVDAPALDDDLGDAAYSLKVMPLVNFAERMRSSS
jgi:hypothetical protein